MLRLARGGVYSLSRLTHLRQPVSSIATSIAEMSMDQWSESFKRETVEVAKMDVSGISYEESATRLRELLKSGLLRHIDLLKNPERFFQAHRLLAEYSPKLGPGFWIRFTVHYNLCVGTIIGLGSDDQIALVEGMQSKGLLGCFSLTEKFAGVNSGLIVNTIADWDEQSETFILSTPNEGAKKNWISQGLVADITTVVADLRIRGKSFGPHAFLMRLREADGSVVAGVAHGDMGGKTVGNDLDNAWIAFHNVTLPKSALLNKYADIVRSSSNGTWQYHQKVKGMPVFHMIGQRLFTGRVAVAQAATTFQEQIFRMTKDYTDNKMCWGGPNQAEISLSTLPQLKYLYSEETERRLEMKEFLSACEKELCEVLRSGGVPSIELVEAIAVAKVRAVEMAIDLTHRLKNEVGSYALMKHTGFDQTDFLQCCKFAEGDSRILMQKMARDRMKSFEKAEGKRILDNAESVMCRDIAKLIEGDVALGRATDKQEAWNLRWREVYALANAVMERTMKEFLAKRR